MSHVATIELVKRFCLILKTLRQEDSHLDVEETQKALFDEIIQIGLWGNASDLTLLSSLSADELGSRQGQRAREASRANIVVNHTGKVWNLLMSIRNRSCPATGIVHIVLDNAGFELLTDLVFASYLLEGKFATGVVLHGKSIPLFVSDVNAKDLESLINIFSEALIILAQR